MGYSSNIWKFYAYRILVSLEISVPIYVLFLLDNNLSMTQVMILQAINTILSCVFELPSGMFADFFGRKKTLVISSVFLALSFFVLGFGSEFSTFLIASAIWALAISLQSGADIALLFDSLKCMKKTKLFPRFCGRANSLEMLTFGLSSIIGGLMAVYLDYRFLIILTAVIFATSIFVSLSLKEPKVYQKAIEKNHLRHLKNAVKFSFTQKTVRYFLLYLAFFGAFFYVLYFLIQPYFDDGIYSDIIVGVAVAGYFLFCALGSFLADRIIPLFNPKNFAILTLFVSSLAFILIPLVHLYLAFSLVFIISFLAGVGWVLANERINTNTKSHHRATVLSVLNFMDNLFYSATAPFMGVIADVYSISAAFKLSGTLIFVVFVAMLLMAMFFNNPKNYMNLILKK